MKKVATKILYNYVSHFIQPFEGSQLDISLFSQDAEIKDAKLTESFFQYLGFSYKVVKGVAKKVKFELPWNSVASQSFSLDIEGIYIYAIPTQEEEANATAVDDLDTILNQENVQKSEFVSQTFDPIFSNLKVNVRDVNIILYNPYICNMSYIKVDNVRLFSCDHIGNETFVVDSHYNYNKKICFENLSFSTSASRTINPETFPEVFDVSNMSFVFKEVSFSALIVREFNSEGIESTNVSIHSDSISLSFDQIQLASIWKFNNSTKHLRFKYPIEFFLDKLIILFGQNNYEIIIHEMKGSYNNNKIAAQVADLETNMSCFPSFMQLFMASQSKFFGMFEEIDLNIRIAKIGLANLLLLKFNDIAYKFGQNKLLTVNEFSGITESGKIFLSSSKDEILRIDFEDRELTVNSNEINLHCIPDILTMIIQSDFFSIDSYLFSYNFIFNNLKIIVAGKSRDLIIKQQLSIKKAENSIQYIARNIECGFKDSNSIFSNANLTLNMSKRDVLNHCSILLELNEITLCGTDIYDLANRVSSMSKPSLHNVDTIIFSTSEISFNIIAKEPIYQGKIPSFSLSFRKNESFECIINSLYANVMNPKTGNWESFIEPFDIKLSVTNNEEQTNYNIEFPSDFLVDFSYETLKLFFDFFHDLKSNSLEYVKTPIILRNMTHEKLSLTMSNNTIDLESRQEIEYNDDNKMVRFNHSLGTFSFSLDELKIPYPVHRKLIISKKKNVVTIYNNVLIKNHTKYSLFYQNMDIEPNYVIPMECTFNAREPAQIQINGNPSSTSATLDIHSLKHKPSILKFSIGSNVKYLQFSLKYNERKGTTFIHISAPIIIHNELPVPLTVIQQNDDEIEILPNMLELIHETEIKQNSLSIGFKVHGNKSTIIKLNAQNKSIIPIVFECKYCLGLLIQQRGSQYHAYVFSPAIFYNYSNFPVHISDLDSTLIELSKNPTFWGQSSYFNNGKAMIPFYIGSTRKYKYSSHPIDASITGVDSPIFLQMVSNDDLYMPLCYKCINTGEEIRSSIVEIKNYVTIHNQLDTAVLLTPVKDLINFQPINDIMLTYPPKTVQPLEATSKDLIFSLQVPIHESQIPISLSTPIHTTIRVERTYIELEILQNDSGLDVYFRTAIIPQPLMVSNMLENEVVTAFQNEKFPPLLVYPLSTGMFTYDSPFLTSQIFLQIRNKTFQLSVAELDTPQKLIITNDICYFAETKSNENGMKIIVISEHIEDGKNSEYSINIAINNFSISLVDSFMREISLVVLSGVEYHLISKKSYQKTKYYIKGLQIDDMYPEVAVPFVVTSVPAADHRFLEVKYKTANHGQSFQLISIRILPILINLDVNFLSEMMALFSCYKPMFSLPDKIIPISRLKLYPIDISLNMRSGSRITRHPFNPLFLLFNANIQGAFRIPGRLFSGLHATPSFIRQRIVDEIHKTVINMLLPFYKRDPCIFEIIPLPPNFIENSQIITEGEFAAQANPAVLNALNTTEGFFKYAVDKMRIASNTTISTNYGGNRTAAQTVGDGFKNAGKSLLKGFTGLITKPIEGAKRGGAKNFFTGLGQGLLGAITGPITATMEGFSGTIAGIRKSLSKDNANLSTSRSPRALLYNELQPYIALPAKSQATINSIMQNPFEQVYFMANLTNDNDSLAITNNFIWRITNTKLIQEKIKIRSCINLTVNGSELHITYKRKKRVKNIIFKFHMVRAADLSYCVILTKCSFFTELHLS